MKYTKEQWNLMKQRLDSPYWRLNNLYHIVDKRGTKIPFKLNHAQQSLWDNVWYCNIILKARQLGISTYVSLLFLDRCLWNANLSAGIIAHTQEDGQQLFRRIKFAYDNLPDIVKEAIKADNDTANMLKFSNGSSIRVGTSLRSSTLQYLHISEFGKICTHYPDKAREIITGSLNTLAAGQYVFIESTAEGREGYFFDMCKQAQELRDKKQKLTKLDFRLHFFPWFDDPSYRLGSTVSISEDNHDYFLGLLSKGIELDLEQKQWYVQKANLLGEDVKREFPSTPEECWEVSNEGSYYGKLIVQARIEGRIGHIPYDEGLLVHTAWDLGFNDSTAIWFFQIIGKEIRLIDYEEGSSVSLESWLNICAKKPYTYGKHLCPHDIKVKEYSSGLSRQSRARHLGFSLLAVAKTDIINGIDACRRLIPTMYFDAKKCEKGLKCIENYRKEWDDKKGCWAKDPLHNWASHGADAFRTLATGLTYITSQKSQAEKDREKLESMRDKSGLLPGSYLYDIDTMRATQDPLRNHKPIF